MTPAEQRILDLIPDFAGPDGWTGSGAVKAIADREGIAQQSVSKHLTALRAEGLIESEGASWKRRHRLAPGAAPPPQRDRLALNATPAELDAVAESAPPGTRIVYHRGELATARGSHRAVHARAKRAAALAAIGRVHLAQRRTPNGFEYLMIVRAAE